MAITADPDGWYRWRTDITEEFAFSPVLVEPHGLKERRPDTCRVQIYHDQAPQVKIVSPTSQMAVQPNDEVDIEFVASDDYAVNRAELVVYGPSTEAKKEPQELQTIPVDLGTMQGAKNVTGTVKLDLSQFALKDGEAISYAMRVYDNRVAPAPADEAMSLEAREVASAGGDQHERASATDRSPTVSDVAPMAEKPSNTPASAPNASVNANDVVAASEDQMAGNRPDARPIAQQSAAAGAASAIRSATLPSDAVADPKMASEVTGGHAAEDTLSARDVDAPSDYAANSSSSTANATQSADMAKMSAGASKKSVEAKNGLPQRSSESIAADSDSPKSTEKGSASLTSDDTAESTDTSATSNKGSLVASKEAGAGTSDTVAANEPASNNYTAKQGDVAVPAGSVPLKTDAKPEVGSSGVRNEPSDSMTKRMLDIPQTGSSSQMQLKIDEWAGSFDGQRREKKALAISPVLFELSEILAEAEQLTDSVAKQLERGDAWQAEHQRDASRAEKSLRSGEKKVDDVKTESKDTPYAFVGLQLSSIVQTHIVPARDSLWEAQDAASPRLELVRSAWQEVVRARTWLEELTKTFERVHREHRLADTAQKMKKMYRVFIEDALARLAPESEGINNYQRKIAEYNLDEEYLERLKEVLEMRRDLQKELARLLSDDPLLLRRFMDRAVSKGDTLRDRLTLLAERQRLQGREVRAWVESDETERPELLAAIILLRQSRLEEIASLSATVSEQFVTWMPFDLSAGDPRLKEVSMLVKTMAGSAQLLAATSAEDADRMKKARKLYDQLTELDAALRRVDFAAEHDGVADHLLKRLADVRKLTMLTSSWIRQADYLDKGEYWQEAAIEQYKIAMETDALAGKLADAEQEFIGIQGSAAGEGAAGIADKVHALLTTLDKELSANQLAATFALRNRQEAAAVEKENASVVAFDKAEAVFDELMRAVIDERDKLPVQDPIASLLDDPTLDELLAELENETRLTEILGIPERPTNLKMIMDWVRPRNGNGGGMERAIAAQMQRDATRVRRKAEEAHQLALARALKEQERFCGERNARPHVAAKTRGMEYVAVDPRR